MLFFYILLLILVLYGLRYNSNGYNQNCFSFETTNAIKGIFILLVFIRHIIPYITSAGYGYTNIGDDFFLEINAKSGQLIVTMFLFYSGYGIMESIKKKGHLYISSIPRKRLLTVLLNFNVAVLVYIGIRWILFGQISLGLCKCLLAFTGWESMGNSNWYIFVIMMAYAITYMSFRLYSNNTDDYKTSCIIVNLLLFVSMVLLSYYTETWWYDTVLCFGAGLLFSNYKEEVEALLKSHYKFTFIVLLVLFVSLFNLPLYLKGLKYNMFSIVFCLMVVMVTLKFRINNGILVWLGQNLFPLYIYQRVPMIILASIDNGMFVASYPVIYTSSCLLITLLIAYFYKYWAIKL